jgi:hypothetical protein
VTNPARLIDEVIAAHGGLHTWQEASAVIARFSSGGLAFTSRFQPHALDDCQVRVATTGQSVELNATTPRPWSVSTDHSAELASALKALGTGRRRWRWSATDVGAFAAMAMWTYLSLPFRLGTDDIRVSVLPHRPGRHRRIEIHFPAELATHSARQTLHIDDTGVLRRHDYTALSFGRWARATQTLAGHRWLDGILVPTVRTVTPRLPGGRPAPHPILVWICIHELQRVESPAMPPGPQPTEGETAEPRAKSRVSDQTLSSSTHDSI